MLNRIIQLCAVSLFAWTFAGQPVHADDRLRVQLLWEHQSQFAGFYVAEARRHFESAGLNVELIEGGPDINPIESLQLGKADIAVSWLGNAWQHNNRDKPVVNVAQLFSDSSLTVLCRISAGVVVPEDIKGKQVGYWGLGDDQIIRAMLQRLNIPVESVELVRQKPNGEDLISGNLPCATSMTYNEYWKVIEAGVPTSDLVMVNPESFGIPHIEDGLYVMAERLDSPDFRKQLVGFIQALRQGWRETRIAPTLAVESVMRVNAQLDRDQQRHMLETVLSTIPEADAFGHFGLQRYEWAKASWLTSLDENNETPRIWTHQIWNELQADEGAKPPLTAATQHYAGNIMSHPVFKALVLMGVLIYALSGVLEAIRRQYDMWGRLILAFLSGIGGGTLRDLLIGDERLPFYYVQDLSYPLGILIVVLAASFISSLYQDVHNTQRFKLVKNYADIIGFSLLAMTGAMVALSSGIAWYWVPICAALTCAGGGMLRDIVVNQEPMTFRGVIYEEVAIITALIFLGCLFIANQFEGTPVPVFISVMVMLFSTLLFKFLILRYRIKYPRMAMLHRRKH